MEKHGEGRDLFSVFAKIQTGYKGTKVGAVIKKLGQTFHSMLNNERKKGTKGSLVQIAYHQLLEQYDGKLEVGLPFGNGEPLSSRQKKFKEANVDTTDNDEEFNITASTQFDQFGKKQKSQNGKQMKEPSVSLQGLGNLTLMPVIDSDEGANETKDANGSEDEEDDLPSLEVSNNIGLAKANSSVHLAFGSKKANPKKNSFDATTLNAVQCLPCLAKLQFDEADTVGLQALMRLDDSTKLNLLLLTLPISCRSGNRLDNNDRRISEVSKHTSELSADVKLMIENQKKIIRKQYYNY